MYNLLLLWLNSTVNVEATWTHSGPGGGTQRLHQKGIIMKTYKTFENVDGMKGCLKRPIIVHAKQINEDFRVDTLEGNYKQGKAGDYLMKGIDGELYICDKDIFEKTYDFV